MLRSLCLSLLAFLDVHCLPLPDGRRNYIDTEFFQDVMDQECVFVPYIPVSFLACLNEETLRRMTPSDSQNQYVNHIECMNQILKRETLLNITSDLPPCPPTTAPPTTLRPPTTSTPWHYEYETRQTGDQSFSYPPKHDYETRLLNYLMILIGSFACILFMACTIKCLACPPSGSRPPASAPPFAYGTNRALTLEVPVIQSPHGSDPVVKDVIQKEEKLPSYDEAVGKDLPDYTTATMAPS